MRSLCRMFPCLLLALSLALVVAPRRAQTVPLYAARNGLMCQSCHFDPNGGGPRNEFGFAFARNRHLLEPEDSTSRWGSLDVSNRIGESMPVYVGVNQRFMLLDNSHTNVEGLERFGFFNMESSIHIAFQPHDRLTLVYTMDGFADGPVNSISTRDAFGLIGVGAGGYVRAGRFRVPFGLRMDDHTVATRAGFGDFGTGGSFLPYDPRFPDMGVEIGMSRGGWFGRAAFTNGASSLFSSNGFAEAKSIKLGYNSSHYQAGISLYDDFVKDGTTPLVRLTRWGYYGMTHFGQLALLWEIAAGTDDARPSLSPPLGYRTNSLAAFAEADWSPRREYNVRVRVDHLEGDRGAGEPASDMATFHRYALEGEWVPVPFAELRATYRYIDAKVSTIPDERQGYLQFHFSY